MLSLVADSYLKVEFFHCSWQEFLSESFQNSLEYLLSELLKTKQKKICAVKQSTAFFCISFSSKVTQIQLWLQGLGFFLNSCMCLVTFYKCMYRKNNVCTINLQQTISQMINHNSFPRLTNQPHKVTALTKKMVTDRSQPRRDFHLVCHITERE